MTAPPYIRFYVTDYLADTQELTCLQHGAYMLLIMAIWRAGGRLPRDDAKLAAITRLTLGQWDEMRAVILAYFVRERRWITHKRVSKEIGHYEDISRTRSDAGKSGGYKKHNKNKRKTEANATMESSNSYHNQTPYGEPKEGSPKGGREASVSPLDGEPAPAPVLVFDADADERAAAERAAVGEQMRDLARSLGKGRSRA